LPTQEKPGGFDVPRLPFTPRSLPLLLAVFVFAVAPGAQAATGAPPLDTVPRIELRQALDLAERYIAAHRIDVSGQHLTSVTLHYDPGTRRRGRYWHFQWSWTSPAIGGEFGLRIYMDGTILVDRLGP